MGAAVTIERRLAWIDTDAAGHWHNVTLWRYAEDAEAQLHRELGIVDVTFGFTPRRHVEADYLTPLRFDETAVVTLEVAEVGRTSATYRVEVTTGDRTVATAQMVVVFIDDDGRTAPWPDHVAAALRDGVAATSG